MLYNSTAHRLIILSACFAWLAVAAPGAANLSSVHGKVLNREGSPLGGVKVVLMDAAGREIKVITGKNGIFACSVEPGDYRVSLKKHGYADIADRLYLVRFPATYLQVTLQAGSGSSRLQKLGNVLAPRASAPSRTVYISAHTSAIVHEHLPDIANTMLDRYGEIRSAGAQSLVSRYLVDAPEQSRPQEFGLMNDVSETVISTPDADSESTYLLGGLPVYESPGAPLERASPHPPGWKVHLHNPSPGLQYQRGFRLGDWAPQLSVSGPLRARSLLFTDLLSGEHALTVVPELPRNADSSYAWAGSNLVSVQNFFRDSHWLKLDFLASRRLDDHIGLSPFNPLQTTVDLAENRLQLGLTHQLAIKGIILESGVKLEDERSALTPQGGTPYILFPGVAAGSYFETLRGHSQQARAFTNALVPWRSRLGSHQFQTGVEASATNFDHFAIRHAFEIFDDNGNPVQLTNFIGDSQFSVNNTRWSGYVQDTWTPWSRFRVQGGVRVDWDRLITFSEFGPRASFAFLPFAHRKTKIFGLWGIYYPELNLALLGQAEDQLRVDEFYGSSPPVVSDFVASFPALRGPHYTNTRMGLEQAIGHSNFLGVSVLSREQRDGLAYQKLAAKRHLSLLPLLNDRRDDYKAVEVSARHIFSGSAEVFASYTRSHSHTNQVFDYDLNSQTFATDLQGPLNYDAPDRLVSWGWSPVIARSFIASYLVEYRTGFPFSVFDENYNLVGMPNSYRFPHLFRLNLGWEKVFGVAGRRIGVRFAVLNATNHGNYTAVDNNTASPFFLQYGASLERSYTVRVRLLPNY